MMSLPKSYKRACREFSCLKLYVYMCRYEVQDLRVTDILPQMVALSESFFQVYEVKEVKGA